MNLWIILTCHSGQFYYSANEWDWTKTIKSGCVPSWKSLRLRSKNTSWCRIEKWHCLKTRCFKTPCWGDSQSWPDGEGEGREGKTERAREKKEKERKGKKRGEGKEKKGGRERNGGREKDAKFSKKIYAGFDKLPKVSFSVFGPLSVVTRRWRGRKRKKDRKREREKGKREKREEEGREEGVEGGKGKKRRKRKGRYVFQKNLCRLRQTAQGIHHRVSRWINTNVMLG